MSPARDRRPRLVRQAARRYRPASRQAGHRRYLRPRYSNASALRRRGGRACDPASPARRSCRPAPLREARSQWRALLPRRWPLRSPSSSRLRHRPALRTPDRRRASARYRFASPAASLPRAAFRGRWPWPMCPPPGVRSRYGSAAPAWRTADGPAQPQFSSSCRRRSAARTLRQDRCRGPAAPRRRAAGSRWSRSAPRLRGSSRSIRRQSPVHRSCG